MKLELITTNSPLWHNALKRCRHDAYHLPSFVNIEAQRLEGTGFAIYAEWEKEVFLLPFVKRSIPKELIPNEKELWYDATSPYGYPGPIFSGTLSQWEEMKLDVFQVLSNRLFDEGIISLFVRLHPLLNPFDQLPIGFTKQHGEVYWIDLSAPIDELQRMVRSRFKSYINASIHSGAKVEIDREFQHFDTFIELYNETMKDVGAADWYFFTNEYFHTLKQELGEHLVFVVVKVQHDVKAAGLYFECDGIVEYHLSGKKKSDEWAHLTKLMMVHMRDWAKLRGNHFFHLGGGVGAGTQSSLTFFKSGFTKTTSPFYSWRLILDAGKFDQLISRWRELRQEDPDNLDGYFPAYRKGF